MLKSCWVLLAGFIGKYIKRDDYLEIQKLEKDFIYTKSSGRLRNMG